jgi:hypothetical protein
MKLKLPSLLKKLPQKDLIQISFFSPVVLVLCLALVRNTWAFLIIPWLWVLGLLAIISFFQAKERTRKFLFLATLFVLYWLYLSRLTINEVRYLAGYRPPPAEIQNFSADGRVLPSPIHSPKGKVYSNYDCGDATGCKVILGEVESPSVVNKQNLRVTIPKNWKVARGHKVDSRAQYYEIWYPPEYEFEDEDSGGIYLIKDGKVVFDIYYIMDKKDFPDRRLEKVAEQLANDEARYGFEKNQIFDYQKDVLVGYRTFTNGKRYLQMMYPHYWKYVPDKSVLVDPSALTNSQPAAHSIDPYFSSFSPSDTYIGDTSSTAFARIHVNKEMPEEVLNAILQGMRVWVVK